MSTISNKNVALLLLAVLLALSSSSAFGLGRAGRGNSFMRAFGMKVQDDGLVHSYYEWSTTLAGMAGMEDNVGPVTAQYGANFNSLFFNVNGYLTNGLNFMSFNSQNQVSFSFLPYGYVYRTGYRGGHSK